MSNQELEQRRQAAVERLRYRGCHAERALQRLVQRAAGALDLPVATLSIIDGDTVYYEISYGLEIQEAPREMTLCGKVVEQDHPLIADDPTHPLIVGLNSEYREMLGCYAGQPIRAGGERVGALCVAGPAARQFHEADLRLLGALAETAGDLLEARVTSGEAFLRQIVDTDPNLIFVKDHDGNFQFVNEATARAYGTTPPALVHANQKAFIPKTEEELSFLEADREVIRTGKPALIGEEPATHADGSVHHYQTIKVPLDLPDGTRHVLGVCTDITKRMEMLEALRESEQRLNESQQLAKIGSWNYFPRRAR